MSENWLAEFETRNIQATTLISQSTKSGRAKEQRVHMHGREVEGEGEDGEEGTKIEDEMSKLSVSNLDIAKLLIEKSEDKNI